MTALEYLESLILGQEVSSIPVQKNELEFLKRLMLNEKGQAREQKPIRLVISRS